MKKTILFLAVAAVLAVSGKAMAVGANDLTVSANVLGTCGFTSATSALPFGALDSGNPVNVNASVTITYLCSKGVVAIVTGPGAGTMTDPVSLDTIAYTLGYTSDPGASTGAAQNLTIDGAVAGGAYAGKTAGNYSQTVTIDVNP